MRPTLFALSSGQPPAAIAIIRISGPRALDALVALGGAQTPSARHATLTALTDPRDGSLLDHALTLFFPEGASVTGEHLVELHLHGGRAIVAATLETLTTLDGLEPAAAGAFTRQAFDNGRLDLTQVEGLGDLLAAETDTQRRRALQQSEGQISRLAQRWREQLLAASARVAATLDFADEGDVDASMLGEAKEILAEVMQDMAGLLATPTSERLRDGIRVVFTGPPNSGKSSLINYLTGRDVAIVTDIPGTTRDLLEASVAIDGMAFVLIDSAGIREAADQIEQEGIARAKRAVESADIVVQLDGDNIDAAAALFVRSKADLSDQPGGWADGVLHVSAADGRGIDLLIGALINRAGQMIPRDVMSLANARQRECLVAAHTAMGAIDQLHDGILVDEHIRRALSALAMLVGQTGVEDMLDALFGRFCIGK